MCLVILAGMLILFYAFYGQVESYQLVEIIDGLATPAGDGWEILWTLWPILGFVFLLGVLTVLLALKVWMPPRG
ncbi:hypothetical protein [Thiomicrorhabdus aquaedulcis]|uniref:hypothetical protein n=1 Tax=Thiomicrorhabdus aquaedulcis TaxID=2211106 RepID=UPI000FD8DD18|nr:hypothetical protein [Thiomicrorhabdus aquaedulcis]